MTKQNLIICNEQGKTRVLISSILYIVTDDYLSTFYLKDTKKHTCSKPLCAFIDCLPDHFFQISRGVIVNLDEIRSVRGSDRRITLSDTTELTVSIRRIPTLHIALASQNTTVTR